MFDPARPETYPPRLLRSEVLALARSSPSKLRERIKDGRMPAPIDRGTEDLFDRDAVLRALGLMQDEKPEPTDGQWSADQDMIDLARDSRVRHGPRRYGRGH